MNKLAVIIGLLVLALSLQGKTVRTENHGLNISGYSKENVTKDITVVEKVRFSPIGELFQK